METTPSFEKMQVVGKGRTQFLFETSFNITPPMSKIIGESYDVEITEHAVFNDRVLIKGTVEKTLYYKHPHGKKNQNDENDNKQDNNQETDDNQEQSDQNAENEEDSAASGLKKSCRLFSKKRKNAREKKDNNKETQSEKSKNKEQKSEKSKEQKSNKKDDENKNNSAASESDENTDEFKCLNGWGQVLDSASGIVHFNQQVSEFSGTVEIPGVMPGDHCHVELVEASNCDPFVAAAVENGNNNGLIETGTQMFAIDVVLVASRSKAEKYSARRKKKARTLPLSDSAENGAAANFV